MASRSDDGLRTGDIVAVIADREITLHRIIKLSYASFVIRGRERRRRFDRKTGLERTAHPKYNIRAYKPTEYELGILRSEIQCKALLKEARYLNDQIAALIRKAGCLPTGIKLATLRSVILYLGRALKRTNALIPNAEIRSVDQGTSVKGNDHSI